MKSTLQPRPASLVAAAVALTLSGVATAQAVDAAAGQGNASGTTAATPLITTTNANDLLLGAINFPRAVTATLATSGFSALNNFNASTVSGRAAYDIVSATGGYSVTWNLSGASTSGGAILALKAAAP